MSCGTGLPDKQFWTNIYSAEVNLSECLTNVQSLLSCPSKIAVAQSFQGNDAQIFIDFLDQVLARSRLDQKLRQRGLRLLSKICKAHGIIPASYILRQELIRAGRVCYRGGFADVSDGEYSSSRVAIKCLRMNEGDFDRIFKRLCREIVGWKHLSHPNILPLLGASVSTDPHRFRIITEWMPSGNVMEYAKNNPEKNRLRLLSQVMFGVIYLHELNVVHGDLKGANILVDKSGAARIADFGFMTMVDLSTMLLSQSDICSGGTFRWMGPELLDRSRFGSSGRPTRESDCYALGMVIYEVLTGLRPFHRLHTFEPVAAVLRGERPEKPHDAGSLGLSDELWGLVELSWSESSSTRPTAQRLLDYITLASRNWDPPPVYPVEWICASGTTDSDSSGSLV